MMNCQFELVLIHSLSQFLSFACRAAVDPLVTITPLVCQLPPTLRSLQRKTPRALLPAGELQCSPLPRLTLPQARLPACLSPSSRRTLTSAPSPPRTSKSLASGTDSCPLKHAAMILLLARGRKKWVAWGPEMGLPKGRSWVDVTCSHSGSAMGHTAVRSGPMVKSRVHKITSTGVYSPTFLPIWRWGLLVKEVQFLLLLVGLLYTCVPMHLDIYVIWYLPD